MREKLLAQRRKCIFECFDNYWIWFFTSNSNSIQNLLSRSKWESSDSQLCFVRRARVKTKKDLLFFVFNRRLISTIVYLWVVVKGLFFTVRTSFRGKRMSTFTGQIFKDRIKWWFHFEWFRSTIEWDVDNFSKKSGAVF